MDDPSGGFPAPLPFPPDCAAGLRGARLAHDGQLLFDGLDLDLPEGSWTCLLGPSGGGKTTVLRLLAGLEPLAPPASRLAPAEGVAWMGQRDLLLPWLSALENTLLGARLRGERRDAAQREKALGLLARLGLLDRAAARPGELSGGMRQRVALARTLMEDRPLVLMDEPFSAVDALARLALQDLAAESLVGRTVLLVTHDPLEALRLADRVLVLSGRPAVLSEAARPPGRPPRRADDPAVLELHGELLRRLSGDVV